MQPKIRAKLPSRVREIVYAAAERDVTLVTDMLQRGMLRCLTDVISHVWRVDVLEHLCLAVHMLVVTGIWLVFFERLENIHFV